MYKRLFALILTFATVVSLLTPLSVNVSAYTEGYDGMGPVRVTGGRRDFSWPVPNNYNLQSCFYDQRDHYALDISASMGTNVVASYGGSVVARYTGCTHNYSKTYTCCNDGYGNYVVLKHTYRKMDGSTITLYSRYSHLTAVSVSVGDTVAQGAKIGTIGSTGYSGGFHLDFQILYGGWSPRQSYSIDPYANQLLVLPSNLVNKDGWSCGISYCELIKEVYATPLTCVLSFNANGGNCAASTQKVVYNTAVGTLPTPTRNGYNFDGWYTAAVNGDKITASSKFTYDTTLYAHWTASDVSITYYGADGTAWLTDSATVGSEYTVTADYPALNGSYFSGWSYTRGSNVFDIRPGEELSIHAAVKLYPVFITHEKAVSGEPVLIYNIKDFTDPEYDAEPVEVSLDREVDTSYWTDWSSYSTTAVDASSTVEVRTTPMYRYYCYVCPYCNAHEPYSGTSDCGYTIPTDAFYTKWSTVAYSQSGYQTFSYTSEKYYTTSLGDGEIWIFDASNLNSSTVGTTDSNGATVIATGYSSRSYVKQTQTVAVPVTAYVLTSNVCKHNYTAVQTPATCQKYGTTTYTCSECGDTYTQYTGQWSDWSTTLPEGVDHLLTEQKTQYRYSDYETKTSYEPSLSGFTLKDSKWEQAATGSVEYVNSWPSGFSSANSLFTKYNQKSSKVSASETATAKTVIDSDGTTGYLYYHWCYANSFYSLQSSSGNYTVFHAFYSTTAPEECSNYDASDGSYYFPNSSCCSNSEWYWPVAVNTQKYTTYKKLFTYERWTDWSDWSDNAVDTSDTRKTEQRTLLRYVDAKLGDHSYVNGACSVCGEAEPVVITDYYLVGYINGADYGCEADYQNMGQYKFVDGSLVTTFDSDSYVFLKANDNAAWYMTETYVTGTSANFYNTLTGTGEKMFVPGGREITFTLEVNSDGSLTLRYVASKPSHSHIYTGTVTKPTCTEEGYTTYTCSCGDSFVADKIPSAGHSFANGICGICGTEDPDYAAPVTGKVEPKSATLSLEDEVLINLYFVVEEMEATPESVGMLIYNEMPETADVATADTVVEGGLYNESNGRYMVSTPGIPGQYLADSLYLVAYAKDANGNYVYARTVEYSGKKYCTSQMTKGTAELKATCVALMNYGAAAQQYFAATTDYTYDTLMNVDFVQYQNLVVDYSDNLLTARQNVDPAKAGTIGTEKNGFTKRSVSMSADGDFSLNYYFTTDRPVDGVTFYYWTEDQYNCVEMLTLQNASGSKEMVLTDGANRYWANFAGIAAKDLESTVFACGIYEIDGVTYSTGIFSYSIGYFCISKASSADVLLSSFAKAIAVYGYHAKSFLGNL